MTETLAAVPRLKGNESPDIPFPDDNVISPLDVRPLEQEEPSAVVYEHLTDTGNAKRMVALHADKIRYCPAHLCWYVWDGRIWARDNTLEVERIAKATVLVMHKEALRIKDDDKRKTRVKHCLSSEGTGRLRAMVENAKSEVVIEPQDLNADPMLLCVENGTLHLNTGKLGDHRPDDFITLMAPVEYRATASDPRWEEVLDRFVRPDDGKEAFLRRAAFASITGTTSDKAFINLFDDNTGNTGKTTFTESLMMVLGPYADVVNAEAFLVSPNGLTGIRADIATLAGKRMVVSSEVPAGRKLDVALMKKLTQGGGTMQFERKYENPWTGQMTFTIWLDGNTVARAPAEDHPLFNRWRLTPFKHKIDITPEEKWVERVRKSAEYRAAVLAWVMKARREWLAEGIGTTASVVAAVSEMKEAMDPLTDFWEECCRFGDGLFAANDDLKGAYQDWAARTGKSHEINDAAFRALLKGRGASAAKNTRRIDGTMKRGWDGVEVAPHPPEAGEGARRPRVKERLGR